MTSFGTSKVLMDEVSAFIYSRNPEALAFLAAFSTYTHAIDDIIDEPSWRNDPERIIATFAHAATLFSSNFFQKNADRLYPTVLLITNAYADSVFWEHKDEDNHVEWKQQFADVLRGEGLNMLLLVLMLVGGYEAARKYSLRLREHFYHEQHDKNGEPT